MIIIGELINSTRKSIRRMIEEKDEKSIADLVGKQHEAGADYIDLNAGAFASQEQECLLWLVEIAKNTCPEAGLSIDTSNADVCEAAMKAAGDKLLVNSISAQDKVYQAMLPLVLKHEACVIALCMGNDGVPKDADSRHTVAKSLVGKLNEAGVPMNRIFVDPLVKTVSTESDAIATFLEAARLIRADFPEVHMTCGLSNVSFGLPARKLLNRTFLSMAMSAGVDSAILDPLDKQLMATLTATKALLGQDEYCMNYISAHRQGLLS